MNVVNELLPDRAKVARFFQDTGAEPFVMVNLLKFREKAAYEDGDRGLSGKDAYDQYGAEVKKLIAQWGGREIFSGAITGVLLGEIEDNWDAVALIEYPTHEAFQGMMSSSEYQKIAVHRSAGLEGQLNIRSAAI